ncbi:MAG: hypothetical protein LBB81_02255 [Treponema sp.]|jgi:hypothetical protein|nr:hypothetical protein [Treponema sp.]
MNRIFLLAPMFLCFAASLSAFGAKEKDSGKAPVIIQVTGIVRLAGNANFPELQIRNSETLWYIARDETDKLHDLQHRTVTVEGEETVTELKFGNGLSAGTRRDLKNIRIIAVE